MNYIRVTFDLQGREEFVSDLLTAPLAEVGFDSFTQESDILIAYCLEHFFSEETMQMALTEYTLLVDIPYVVEKVENKNWNEEWEKNSFQPIIIANRCAVHHPKDAVGAYEYDILIDPCMAFGTAYHDTTYQIIEHLLDMDFNGKRVLDMGCGTGVLAIVAAKRGATSVTAIDIDEFSYKNAMHNAELNNVLLTAQLGDASLLQNVEYDIILANINRNILLNDMSSYVGVLAEDGEILFSGFYTSDIPLIEKRANELGLLKKSECSRNDWAVLTFEKQ